MEQTVADTVDTTALKGSAQTFLFRSTLNIPRSTYFQITLFISNKNTSVFMNNIDHLILYLSIKLDAGSAIWASVILC